MNKQSRKSQQGVAFWLGERGKLVRGEQRLILKSNTLQNVKKNLGLDGLL
jgi:hypothetical protein